ncbi:adenosine kinase [Candidatus Woesearchaeota archaeon]|nr:adenosine kinase [Candidatus Woesearchaeota archaeon]
MDKELDVISIENTLMDILIQVDDAHLAEFNLKKGSFHLIEEEKANQILQKFEHQKPKLTPAGSGANTIMGIANLGGKCILVGRVGKDPHGNMYEDIITKDKIHPRLIRCDKSGTGRCFSFITPDAERTFAVHLGAAVNLEKENILDEDIKKSKILHLTGYMLESPNLREIAVHAMEVAKENEVIISMDLADAHLIRRCKEDLWSMVKKYVNIIFVNEGEAEAFTDEKDPLDALKRLAAHCDIAIVKLGPKGSLIKSKNEIFHIQAYKTKVIDTTGAGDLYAAGFLWSYLQKKPLELCGKIGSFLAARVISQIGARIEQSMIDLVNKIE